VAVALDDEGNELERVTQRLNLPRQPAETAIILTGDGSGQQRTAKVSWESLVDTEPSAVRVEFDGRPLDCEDPRTIPLPPHDPGQLHFLRVDLEFGDLVTSSAEITFGGTYSDRINSELTAIPVQLVGRKRSPSQKKLQDWFASGEQSLHAAAVDKGRADLVIVRDRSAWPQLYRIQNMALTRPYSSSAGRPVAGSRGVSQQWFRSDQSAWRSWTFQFFWAFSRRVDGTDGPYDVFPHSQKYTGDGGSLHGWVTTVEPPADSAGPQRLADTVAVAGVTAAGSNRRRAVLLILGPQPEDTSDITPGVARRYLDRLHVPLFVWTIGSKPATVQETWGEAIEVKDPSTMAHASRELFRFLERQRIVWLDGFHLPQEIALDPRAHGIRLVGDAESRLPDTQAWVRQDEPVLGKPSPIELDEESQERLRIEAGARLRQSPHPDSPILEILAAPVEFTVLERRGVWIRVRHAGWQAWIAPGGEDSATSPDLMVSYEPDEARLLRARDLLATDSEAVPLGPFTLYTDVDDPQLLRHLGSVADSLAIAYRSRYGMDPGVTDSDALVLLAREEDYREFESSEPEIAGSHTTGYTTMGLCILYAGERSVDDLTQTLIHELTHLFNRRAMGVDIPIWLEEGMAQDMAFSKWDKNGRIAPGSLGGSVRREVTDLGPRGKKTTIEISGPLASLNRLLLAWSDAVRPTLEVLVEMPKRDFIRSENRSLLYAESAFLIRYLLDGGQPTLTEGFQRYLVAVATSSDLAGQTAWSHLEEDPAKVETGLHLWLRSQAITNGLRLPNH
jgi:hypothetical protein